MWLQCFQIFKRQEENNYHVADVKSGKSETEKSRVKSLSASIIELKKWIEDFCPCFTVQGTDRVAIISGKESYNFKVCTNLKHNLLGVNGYAKCNTF